MKLRKRFLFLLIFTPVLVLMIAALSYLLYRESERLTSEMHAQSVTRKYLREVFIELLNAETGQRGYLLTGKERFLEPYYQSIKNIKMIEKEFADDEALLVIPHSDYLLLKGLADRKITYIEVVIGTYNAGEQEKAFSMVRSEQGKRIMDSIRTIIEPSIRSLDKKLETKQSSLNRYSLAIIGLVFFALAFVSVICILFYQSVVSEFAQRDIMNKALESKNKQLRDFTYQSYHQLKTPLRNIGGFLQLLQKKSGDNMDEESKEMIIFSVNACEQMNEQIDEIRKMYLE